MITYFDLLLDILFPPVCFSCRRSLIKNEPSRIFCGSCLELIPINTAFTCPVCRGRLPAVSGRRCHKNADYLLFAYSSYSSTPLRALIWQLKFRRRASAAAELAGALYASLTRLNFSPANFICVPIPLHAGRLRWRGFNQAELIAKEFAVLAAIPVCPQVLKKDKKTRPQTEMKDKDERRQNLNNCFRVSQPELVAGKNILLVDDVWTSGATMNEACRALKSAGAAKIIGLVLAKAG